jgi:hypothetical protein
MYKSFLATTKMIDLDVNSCLKQLLPTILNSGKYLLEFDYVGRNPTMNLNKFNISLTNNIFYQ